MKAKLVALIGGLVFALGLGLSGMTNPWKVYAFLDVGGAWDPSLSLVMAGAILVYGIGFPLVKKRARPVLDAKFHVPEAKILTPALFIGSTLFGLGWALAGYCPGPGIVSLATLGSRPILFVAFMLIGMLLFHRLNKIYKIKR